MLKFPVGMLENPEDKALAKNNITFPGIVEYQSVTPSGLPEHSKDKLSVSRPEHVNSITMRNNKRCWTYHILFEKSTDICGDDNRMCDHIIVESYWDWNSKDQSSNDREQIQRFVSKLMFGNTDKAGLIQEWVGGCASRINNIFLCYTGGTVSDAYLLNMTKDRLDILLKQNEDVIRVIREDQPMGSLVGDYFDSKHIFFEGSRNNDGFYKDHFVDSATFVPDQDQALQQYKKMKALAAERYGDKKDKCLPEEVAVVNLYGKRKQELVNDIRLSPIEAFMGPCHDLEPYRVQDIRPPFKIPAYCYTAPTDKKDDASLKHIEFQSNGTESICPIDFGGYVGIPKDRVEDAKEKKGRFKKASSENEFLTIDRMYYPGTNIRPTCDDLNNMGPYGYQTLFEYPDRDKYNKKKSEDDGNYVVGDRRQQPHYYCSPVYPES